MHLNSSGVTHSTGLDKQRQGFLGQKNRVRAEFDEPGHSLGDLRCRRANVGIASPGDGCLIVSVNFSLGSKVSEDF